MKFESILNSQVDMEKVDLDSIKPWISNRITEILKHEDEVVIEYVFNQLEPQYPDPKDIQANLSGFFSMKNARIFLADLWKQLLDSMSSIGDRNGTRNSQRVTEKIRSFPKLPSPDNDKVIPIKYSERQRSEHRDDRKRYRSRRSNSSYSRSESYRPRYRSRRRSTSRYRSSRYNDHYRHSRSRSSTGHTPYTRYSDYTNERDRFSKKSATVSSTANNRSSSSSASSSSSSSSSSSATVSSVVTISSQTSSHVSSPGLSSTKSSSSSSPSLPDSRTMSPINDRQYGTDDRCHSPETLSPVNIQIEDDGSMSDAVAIECVPEQNECITKEPSEANIITPLKSTECRSDRSSKISKEIEVSNHREYLSDQERSQSPSPLQPESLMSNTKCQRSLSTSSSSSSEYTIEYVEKCDLINSDLSSDESDESDDNDSCSDVEWVTMEEFEAINKCFLGDRSSSSSSSSVSKSSNEVWLDDEVVWLDRDEIETLHDDNYQRLL